jgi:hypothetical protein
MTSEKTKRGLFLKIALSVVLSLALVLYLFASQFGKSLEFKKGRIFYKAPVRIEEIQKIGDAFVQEGIFDGVPKRMQLTKKDGTYQLRIPLVGKKEDTPLFRKALALRWGALISSILENTPPVEVHLTNLLFRSQQVLTPDILGLVFFEKKIQLFYQSPLRKEEMERVATFLDSKKLFADLTLRILFFHKEGETYIISFVVPPEFTSIPLLGQGLKNRGKEIATEVFQSTQYKVQLRDAKLQVLQTLE